jgi:hypothetical protein
MINLVYCNYLMNSRVSIIDIKEYVNNNKLNTE